MFLGEFFLLAFFAALVAATVVIVVRLFANRSNAQRWPRVMGRAHAHLIEQYPNGQSTWSRSQWERAISLTSGDRYLYLLDAPRAAPPSRAVRWGPWWAVAVFAVIWAVIAVWILNAVFSGRPVDRSDLIGTWIGHGSASEGAVVVELHRDGTYTASGFRFPAELDHTGTWTLSNYTNGSGIVLVGRTFGENLNVTWNLFQPSISVCNEDPDDPRSCTTLVKTAPAD